MRDAVNKAARFIVNQCLNDRVGNIIVGWNEGQKSRSNMGKRNNQNFVVIPTGRLIERLKQLFKKAEVRSSEGTRASPRLKAGDLIKFALFYLSP
ncbi:transposase [Kalymmatonema gypsitolerans NIES-4073]|nr:transposase [Scytonema sp. NIES-4073]